MARKHISQMSALEKSFVHGDIRKNADRLTACGHFYDRATERMFTLAEAQDTVRKGLVVEVHNDRAEIRVLVRDKSGVCVVVALDTLEVVTVYCNAPSDQHETLNWNAYRWNVDLVSVIKSLIQKRGR